MKTMTAYIEESFVEQSEIKPKAYFANKINYINFYNKSVNIVCHYNKYGRIFTYKSPPLPISQNTFTCSCDEEFYIKLCSQQYIYQYLEIDDDKEIIRANPIIVEKTKNNIVFKLPDRCYKLNQFEKRLILCHNINITIYQYSVMSHGKLLEFSTNIMTVEVMLSGNLTLEWINHQYPVTIIINEGDSIYYTGECNVLLSEENKSRKSVIYKLEIVKKDVPRFKSKMYRNTRIELIPSPNVVFTHPITKNKINMKVYNISGSGLSFIENIEALQLVPGLMLPELEIHFASSFKIKCSAQIVYCTSTENSLNENQTCGIAFLDMDMKDHINLLSLLQQAIDQDLYLCNEVDMEELWNFFFRAGFIYPGKYEQIQRIKEKIKDTYYKIYTHHPQIARHFIHQHNGSIMGHMAMIRFCHNSWMIHHHVATEDKNTWSGVKVLGQLIRYANNVHNLASAHMRYVFSYYQADKKFPRRVLGGLADNLRDPKKCSLDTFAYFVFNAQDGKQPILPQSWSVEIPDRDDYLELEFFYEDMSNGLLLDAFELHFNEHCCQKLANEYYRIGFKKNRYIFCLKHETNLKAFYIINTSELGLNMSDLANCVKIIIIDSVNMNDEILLLTLYYFSKYFELNTFPVLVYPANHILIENINIQKVYTLWILDLQFIDSFISFYQRLLGRYL